MTQEPGEKCTALKDVLPLFLNSSGLWPTVLGAFSCIEDINSSRKGSLRQYARWPTHSPHHLLSAR